MDPECLFLLQRFGYFIFGFVFEGTAESCWVAFRGSTFCRLVHCFRHAFNFNVLPVQLRANRSIIRSLPDFLEVPVDACPWPLQKFRPPWQVQLPSGRSQVHRARLQAGRAVTAQDAGRVPSKAWPWLPAHPSSLCLPCCSRRALPCPRAHARGCGPSGSLLGLLLPMPVPTHPAPVEKTGMSFQPWPEE